jgi:hypothetical protein
MFRASSDTVSTGLQRCPVRFLAGEQLHFEQPRYLSFKYKLVPLIMETLMTRIEISRTISLGRRSSGIVAAS